MTYATTPTSAVMLDAPFPWFGGKSSVAADVRKWCADNGRNPSLRIVLAGYDGEHNELERIGWGVFEWKARGGYGSQGDGRGRSNASKERLWLSPHCMGVAPDLFAGAA